MVPFQASVELEPATFEPFPGYLPIELLTLGSAIIFYVSDTSFYHVNVFYFTTELFVFYFTNEVVVFYLP